MKKAVLGSLVVLACLANSAKVGAEDAVLNNPSATVETVKRVVNILNPSYETLWLWSGGTFSQGVSASLWNIESKQIPIASLRLGFGTNDNLYTGLGLDLPGITKRFVPEIVKGVATTKPLDVLWAVAGKYARVTPIAGYSWGENKPIFGVAIGAALSF